MALAVWMSGTSTSAWPRAAKLGQGVVVAVGQRGDQILIHASPRGTGPVG